MLIPWLSRYFYFYYPALIVLVCAATLFSLGTRLASLLGYQKFLGEDDFSADYIDEGKALMKRGQYRVYCTHTHTHTHTHTYMALNSQLCGLGSQLLRAINSLYFVCGLFVERRIREKSLREKGKMKSSEVSTQLDVVTS